MLPQQNPFHKAFLMKKVLPTIIITLAVILTFIGCEGAGAGDASTGDTGNGGGSDEPPAASQGTLASTVKDAVSGDALDGVTINILDAGGSIEKTVSPDTSGKFSVVVKAEAGKQVVFEKSGFLSVTYYNVTAPADETTYLETLLQIDSAYSSTEDASGTITDASTGNPLGGVNVSLRTGVNSYSGNVIDQTTTDDWGAYSFSGLDAGHYTAEIVKSGYTTAHFTLFVLGGNATTDNNSSMTPNIASGEIRIILDWALTPSDLDTHTTGPSDGSSDRFHVYYSMMGDETSSPYTTLDVDDVTSYGPETTTIYQQFPGDYVFYVHDYSNRYASSSTELGNSRARVRVYFGGNLERTFYVPSGDGTLWKVFKLNGTTIMPINQLMYESSPSGVSARSLTVTQDEPGLFDSLPSK